ncbi:MAG: 23S rRNA pseudouridine(2604) synthase RluF [Chitinophagaceae bacterium]
MHTDSISLNKFISDTGYCSRREADNLIAQGRVLLNDKPAKLGNRYTLGDAIEVDGRLITTESELKKKEDLIYIAFNKPVGITTTTEEKIKGNIISFINHKKRIFPIGRLDKDSEGLIFLTNDGNIVNKILRAGNNHEKEYIVRVDKPITDYFVKGMASGVRIKDGLTNPCYVKKISSNTFKIILTQGMNRQIRKMCDKFGYTVTSLQRIRIMNIKLDVGIGKWRYLTTTEMDEIMEMVKDSSKTHQP